MSKDREWNQIDDKERGRAERLFGALAGVDEELLARSEEKAQSRKVIPLWRYGKAAAACLCMAVLGVACLALSQAGILGGSSKDMASTENTAYSILGYEVEEPAEADTNGESYAEAVVSEEASWGEATSMTDEYMQDREDEKKAEAASESEERENGVNQESVKNNSGETDSGSGKEMVMDVGPAMPENVELDLTMEDAENTEVLADYIPQVPQGYVLDNVTRSFTKNSIGEKEYYELYILWRKGMDNISISITQLDTKTEELYREQLVDVENEASYNTHLYDTPYVETVPQEYRQVFDDPVFAAEDMSLDIVRARMKSHNDRGDTNTPRGKFSILYDNGILLRFSGDCDAQAVWNMLKDMAG